MDKYYDNCKLGLENEIKVLPIINEYFKDNIKHIENKYSKFDYKGNQYLYELKTRNNENNKYPTTILPKDKLCDNLILLFSFSNGLYYIKYEKEVFDKFECKIFKRSYRGIHDVEKEYIYIPITKLIKIK